MARVTGGADLSLPQADGGDAAPAAYCSRPRATSAIWFISGLSEIEGRVGAPGAQASKLKGLASGRRAGVISRFASVSAIVGSRRSYAIFQKRSLTRGPARSGIAAGLVRSAEGHAASFMARSCRLQGIDASWGLPAFARADRDAPAEPRDDSALDLRCHKYSPLRIQNIRSRII
jgi:hypothetical protein